MKPHIYNEQGNCLNCMEADMSEHDHNHPYIAHPGSIGKHDHIAHSPGSEVVMPLLTAEECDIIECHLTARTENNIPTAYIEDIPNLGFIINRFRGRLETFMGIPVFRDPPPDPTYDEKEIRRTCAMVNFARCVEAHRSDVYCSGCRPAYTPDYVGTFDIGKPGSVEELIDRINTRIDEVDTADKGPDFEARLKNMEGKAPMSLLSPIFIEGICAVLAHGSKKYAPNMWRDDPMSFTAELDSIFRHLFAFLRCEDYDAAPPSGSGSLHLFNAACRLMFLTERYFTHPELDDRYPAPGLENPFEWVATHQEGAEAQYEDNQLNDMGREELYDLIHSLASQIDTLTEEE